MHDARLATNAYHFGPGRGLSLKVFVQTLAQYFKGWEIKSVAKIIQE